MIFKNEYDLEDNDNDNDINIDNNNNDSDSDSDNNSDCDSNDSFDENVYLKISDFGISHVIQINSNSNLNLNSDEGNINGKAYMKYKCGTYYYTAPEVKDVEDIF
jgi:serine/threonine protein kinase